MKLLRSTHLSRYPVVFRALTGQTLAQFDILQADFGPRYRAAEEARLNRPDRRRARGGGRHTALGPRDQLLLPVLEAAGLDTFRLPDPGKGKRPTLDALLADTPELAVIVDSCEQRVQRPCDRAAADTYYSGKKKQHTLKSQVAIDERDGRVVDVPPSVRGPTNDLTLLKDSGLLDRLPDGVGTLGDLAYVGIATLHPAGATPRRKPRGKPRPAEDIAYNTAFARRRVPVEHTIGRLRCYQALSQTDRHHRRHHTRRVRAIA